MFCSQSAGCKPGQGDKFCWKHHQCHQPTLPESLWFPARHAAAPDLDVRSEIESTMNGGSLWQCNVAGAFQPNLLSSQVARCDGPAGRSGSSDIKSDTRALVQGPICPACKARLLENPNARECKADVAITPDKS